MMWKLALLSLVTVWLPIQATDVFDLRLKREEGKVWAVRERQKITMQNPGVPGKLQNIVTMDIRHRVKAIAEDGQVTMELTITRVDSGQSYMNQMLDFSVLIDIPLIVIEERSGKVIGMTRPDELPEEAIPAFEHYRSQLMSYGLDMFVPNRTVSEGETWQNQFPIAIDVGDHSLESMVEMNYEMMGEQLVDGKKLTKVQFKGKFTGSFKDGVTGSLSGAVDGSYLFDEQIGDMVMIELQTKEHHSTTAAEGEVNRIFELDVKSERVPLEAIR